MAGGQMPGSYYGQPAAPQQSSMPAPPIFGFARDDNINLEDIFADWFADEMGASNLGMPTTAPSTQVTYPPPQQQLPGYPHMNVGMTAQPYIMQQPQQYAAQPDPLMPQPMIQAQPMVQMSVPAPAPAHPAPVVRPMPPKKDTTPIGFALPHSSRNGGRRKTAFHEEDDDDDDDEDDFDEEDDGTGLRKKKRVRTNTRRMTEEQRVERRERNREHAKRSRVRKKFLLESLQKSVNALQEENDKLKAAIKDHLGEQADGLLKECEVQADESLITADPSSATKILDDPDYTLVKALQTAQQNFVITDPSLPDNPIVYASQGFLNLTGYSMEQILGRNCRFLQGPDTDPEAVDKIRRAIEEGVDGSVCLLNYREDGTTFWNQFFIAALRGADGNIVNYVGVQCKVSEEYAKEVLRAESEKEKTGVMGQSNMMHPQQHRLMGLPGGLTVSHLGGFPGIDGAGFMKLEGTTA